MHELSLCNAIADTVIEHAGGRRVESVRLRIGHFRQVVPDTLQFCWSARISNSALAGCELAVIDVPAVIECRTCRGRTTLDEPMLVCAGCGSNEVDMLSGEEFLIESIDVSERTA